MNRLRYNLPPIETCASSPSGSKKFSKTLRQTATVITLAVFLILLLTACSKVGKAYRLTRAKMGADINVTVEITESANQNFPIALDIVVVSEQQLLDLLKNMTAKEWFEKRTQIERDYIRGIGFEYWSWEWVPGQLVKEIELPWKYNAVGAVVFADYLSPGAHRVTINPFENVYMRLLENDFIAEIVD